MVLLLSLFLTVTNILAFLLRPKLGILVFVTLMSCTPRYIGWGAGSDGYAITAQRQILIVMMLLVFVRVFMGFEKSFWRNTQFVKTLYLFLISLYIISLFSGVLESNSYAYFAFIEDLLYIVLVCYIARYFGDRDSNFFKLVKYAFFVPIVAISFFVCVEVLRGVPLLSGIVNVDSAIATERDYFNVVARSGRLRAAALFNGSLQLGEFSTYCFISVIGAFHLRYISKSSFFLLLFCSLIGVVGSGSRSALLIIVISTVVFYFCYISRLANFKSRFMLWFSVLAGLALIVVLLGALVSELQVVQFYEITNASERSKYARLLQYKVVPELVSGSPLIGYGYLRNTSAYFDQLVSIDNYYFVLVLQSGLLGLTLYGLFLLFVLRISISRFTRKARVECLLGIYLFTLLIAFALFKLFLSMPDNNIYVYIVVFSLLTLFSRSNRAGQVSR